MELAPYPKYQEEPDAPTASEPIEMRLVQADRTMVYRPLLNAHNELHRRQGENANPRDLSVAASSGPRERDDALEHAVGMGMSLVCSALVACFFTEVLPGMCAACLEGGCHHGC